MQQASHKCLLTANEEQHHNWHTASLVQDITSIIPPYRPGRSLILPISHMIRRQALRLVKDLAQGHIACEWCSEDEIQT